MSKRSKRCSGRWRKKCHKKSDLADLKKVPSAPIVNKTSVTPIVKDLQKLEKKGVQMLLADPAWTSVAGRVKYASNLGLPIDKAAATIEYIFKPKNVVGLIARSAALSREKENAHRLIGGQWVKVASRKEMPPPKMQGIWLEEVKKAQDAKSKAVKKRGPAKVPKAQQASIPEERGVWAFWKWTGSQLGRARAGWGKRLKELLTKDVWDGAGNP